VAGRHRATVWKVLKRHGVARRRRGTRRTFKRREWSQRGALLHIDAYNAPKFVSNFDAYNAPKFDTPGHRLIGERDKHGPPGGLGKTVVIAVRDDHSRLVYAELHSAENARNVSIALRRGAQWMRE
jgi:hypothetical protein